MIPLGSYDDVSNSGFLLNILKKVIVFWMKNRPLLTVEKIIVNPYASGTIDISGVRPRTILHPRTSIIVSPRRRWRSQLLYVLRLTRACYLSEFHATNSNGVVTVGKNANQTNTINVRLKCRLFSYVSATSSFANLLITIFKIINDVVYFQGENSQILIIAKSTVKRPSD